MKYLFIFVLASIFLSCEKEEIIKSDDGYVNVIYEIQTNDIGFTYVSTQEYDVIDGANPNNEVNWQISSVGTFKKTVRIKRGFMAEIIAAHPTSNRWIVRILDANENFLTSSEPTFFPSPSNNYFAGVGIIIN